MSVNLTKPTVESSNWFPGLDRTRWSSEIFRRNQPGSDPAGPTILVYFPFTSWSTRVPLFPCLINIINYFGMLIINLSKGRIQRVAILVDLPLQFI